MGKHPYIKTIVDSDGVLWYSRTRSFQPGYLGWAIKAGYRSGNQYRNVKLDDYRDQVDNGNHRNTAITPEQTGVTL